MPDRRRRWRTLLMASLVVLAVVPAVTLLARATWPAGERPIAVSAPAARAPSPAPDPGAPSTPIVGTRSARLADQPPPEATVAPLAVRAEAVDIAAPVDPVSVEAGATAMEVPQDPARVGWYRWGPAPGQAHGVAVLTAHVDSRRRGPGAFFRLRGLAPGDTVEVELADGRRLVYEVTGREQVGKDDLPVADLFRREGAPALALITCGGEFDTLTRRYTDNVIVWALPVDV